MTDYTNLRKIVTGDIIIKCRIHNEIRRIPINQVPTYDELCLMMYRVFKSEISKPENIILKYMDNEGDMISLLDDVDITHAISISSLLKVTVYDKASTNQQFTTTSEIKTSFIELRDKLNDLIKSFEKFDTELIKPKEETHKTPTTRRLTSAELAQFLVDDNSKADENKSSPIKELTATLSSNISSSSGQIPYYPPPSSQPHQSQPQMKQPTPIQPPAQQQQQQTLQQQYPPPPPQQQTPQQQYQQPPQHYIQTATGPPPPPPSANGLSAAPPPPQQKRRPVSIQQQPSSQNTPPYPPPPQIQQHASYGTPNNYTGNNNAMDPRLSQQQQPPRQPQQKGYYVPPPPPPSSMNQQTPQLPPQPYNPSTARW